jgi:hypothetical protein
MEWSSRQEKVDMSHTKYEWNGKDINKEYTFPRRKTLTFDE